MNIGCDSIYVEICGSKIQYAVLAGVVYIYDECFKRHELLIIYYIGGRKATWTDIIGMYG